jgi:sugar phosphate isomerase/epimerase
MSRPVSIFSGQWADLPFEEFCGKVKSFGYDGIEIAGWGDHLDIKRAVTESGYAEDRKAILRKHGLKTWVIALI